MKKFSNESEVKKFSNESEVKNKVFEGKSVFINSPGQECVDENI